MYVTRRVWWLSMVLGILVGCQDSNKGPTMVKGTVDPEEEERQIQAHLAELEPADRELAERQRMCPIMGAVRLGASSQGTPVKLMIKGQTVFVCCSECEVRANRTPDQTLAKVKALVDKAPKPAGTAKK